MSHIINCKKKISPENFFYFLIYSCSVNLLSVYQKIMVAFRVTFLATELRVIGHALCSFANKIGNVPWQH